MTFAVVRTQLAILLKTVTGIGKVHEFIRHSRFLNEYLAKNKDVTKINVCEISRIAFEQELFGVGNLVSDGLFHDTHTTIIRLYQTVNDELETEIAFQNLIDAIVLKIRQNNTLNGTVILPKQLQAPTIGHETFGGVLVHFAEMTFEAIERVGDS